MCVVLCFSVELYNKDNWLGYDAGSFNDPPLRHNFRLVDYLELGVSEAVGFFGTYGQTFAFFQVMQQGKKTFFKYVSIKGRGNSPKILLHNLKKLSQWL